MKGSAYALSRVNTIVDADDPDGSDPVRVFPSPDIVKVRGLSFEFEFEMPIALVMTISGKIAVNWL